MINIEKIWENSHFEYGFSNIDLDAGALKMWEVYVWKSVASRKSSTGFKTARVISRKLHSFWVIVWNFYDQKLLFYKGMLKIEISYNQVQNA